MKDEIQWYLNICDDYEMQWPSKLKLNVSD